MKFDEMRINSALQNAARRLLSPPASVGELNPAAGLVYVVSLIVPMLGGGVSSMEPDLQMPFRTKGVRGQLRHWWRLMALAGDFDNLAHIKDAKHNPDSLRLIECGIWGGIAIVGSPIRSRITIRISDQKPGRKFPFDSEGSVDSRVRGLEYLLFPARGPKKSDDEEKAIGKFLIPVGSTFRLDIEVAGGVDIDMIKRVVQVWATFGGIGSRTRRGIGAIAVRDAAGHLVTDLTVEGACRTQAISTIHIFPEGFESGVEALKPLAKKYHEFRKRMRIGDHSVYPWSAFGMPVQFKTGRGKKKSECVMSPPNLDRLASPLLLRPVQTALANGQTGYAGVVAQLALGEHNPPISKVELRGSTRDTWLAPAWDLNWRVGGGRGSCGGIAPLEDTVSASTAGQPPPQDAVTAFLNHIRSSSAT